MVKTSKNNTEFTPRSLHVLLIEDDRTDFLMIQSMLRSNLSQEVELSWAPDYTAGLQGMISNSYDLYLLDYRLGPEDGLSLLREGIRQGCKKPVIFLTGFSDYQLDLEAMRNGAVDFLLKDKIEAPLLERSMRYAIEHWQAKQNLEASLREKDILLKEIHHRVKNNLQIVSSLLKLQARSVNSSESSLLDVCCDRIRSIALVHEKLYRTQDLEAIDFTEYAKSLVDELIASLSLSEGLIETSVEGEAILLPITVAVPCGLILHELITNSLKHAFPNYSKGKVRVVFKKLGDEYLLSVSDNGIGFSGDELPIKNNSLGMELVKTLVEQLEGKLTVNGRAGAEVRLTFPHIPTA